MFSTPPPALRGLTICIGALVLLTACQKKSQRGTVIGKQFIPAVKAEPGQDSGTASRDQWRVQVTLANGRTVTAPVDEPDFKALSIGDSVNVDYSEGNYTHTIWRADLKR